MEPPYTEISWNIEEVAKKPVSKGTLVCEYLGEIIDELEKGEREKAGDCEYASNKSIDAKYFGNIARYCNHSCNPNCIADEWTCDGGELESVCSRICCRFLQNSTAHSRLNSKRKALDVTMIGQ
ncbi:hypothetical protein PI124_g17895 [Phytophthora idaei]|nr:hypothetical protein PI124_g17895 [Phytophthora idaei]